MARPKKVTLADGTVRYRVVFDAGRDPESGKRRQLTRTFGKLKEANAELARVSHQRATGAYVPPSKLTLDKMLDGWLESATFEKEAGTRSNYAHALRPARDRLGDRLVQSITREDIEDLRNWMLTAGRKRGGKPGTGLGARSVRLTLSRLAAAFDQALDDGKVTRNPVSRVRRPKMTASTKTAWSEGEARQFLAEAAEDRLHAAWRMALYGGRREEVCGARWEEDIDLEARTWTVNVVRVVVDGKVIVKEAPKSERSARTLPLDDSLVAALTALHKRQAGEKLAAGEKYCASGYVVCDELGEAVNPEWVSDEFGRVAKRAGVRCITLHETRHTAASLMEKAGVPESIRAAWCGHTVQVHKTTYVHARPEDLAAARDVLSRLYEATGEGV
jgi:integrase